MTEMKKKNLQINNILFGENKDQSQNTWEKKRDGFKKNLKAKSKTNSRLVKKTFFNPIKFFGKLALWWSLYLGPDETNIVFNPVLSGLYRVLKA